MPGAILDLKDKGKTSNTVLIRASFKMLLLQEFSLKIFHLYLLETKEVFPNWSNGKYHLPGPDHDYIIAYYLLYNRNKKV